MELTQIVTRNKLKAIDALEFQSQMGQKTLELYNLIVDGKVKTDEGAFNIMYPKAKTTTGYRKIKAKLKSKLLNALFLIDAKKPSYSDRKVAYYECYRDWAAAKILIGKNAFGVGIKLTRKVLFYALKYEFTDLALECARSLRLYYSTKEGDLKLFKEYHALSETLSDQNRAENEIEFFYTDLLVHFVKKSTLTPKMKNRIERSYEQCQPLMDKYTSYNVQLYGFLISCIIHSSRGNHRAILELCEKSRLIFEQKEYQADTPFQIIHYQTLVSYIQLRQINEGRLAAQKCLELTEPGTFNWFKYKELELMLCAHTGHYKEAFQLIEDTTSHQRFPYLTDNAKEIWKIFEAYVLFALWAKGNHNTFKSSSFRLGRFLNEIPIFSKDKRGLNVAILIAQFLLLLREKRYDEMIDRAEALYKYGIRYLQEEDTKRSLYFIKLILIVVKNSFVPEVAQAEGEVFIKKLRECPLVEVRQLHQIEIIPFEILWEMMLELLPDQVKAVSA